MVKGLGRGGIEQFLARAAAHVDPERYHLELAYLLPWKDAFVADFQRHGVRVHCLGGGDALDPRWILGLRRLVTSQDWDLVHTHMPYPAIGARLVVPWRLPIVHTEHNVWASYRRLTYWANALSYGRNRRALAVSEGVARSIRRPRLLRLLPMPPVEVMAHGIDDRLVETGPEARAGARELLGLGSDDLVVGTVGSLTSKKDQANLIDAVSILAPDHPSLQVVVIGGGPLEAQLLTRIERRGLTRVVRLLGCRSDVLQVLPALDVFALSSRYEGLPLALVEAAATGLPCVATDVGGASEVVEDGATGFLVPSQDPHSLAGALAKLLDDPGLRMSMGSRAAAGASKWNVVSAAERMQRLYDEVLGAQKDD
ncbi:MAG: glycosyltransferase [Acidimicrobiia bacterium]